MEGGAVKRGGKPNRSTSKLTFYIPSEALRQIQELVTVLNIPRGAVIAQAIAKAYYNEPLIQKRRSNGAGDP